MTAACPSIRFRLVLASMGLVLQFSGAVSPTGAQVLVPLSAEQARPILGSEDEFTRRMSAFGRSARMKTDQPVSTAEYLRFAASAQHARSSLSYETNQLGFCSLNVPDRLASEYPSQEFWEENLINWL